MGSGIYNEFLAELLKGLIDLDSHTIKVALMTSGHSFDRTQSGWASVSANEVAVGNGYTAGGAVITCTVTNPINDSYVTASDPTWENSAISAYHAVIYDDSHAGKCLIGSIDFGMEKASSNGGTFKIDFSYILRLQEYSGLLPGEQAD